MKIDFSNVEGLDLPENKSLVLKDGLLLLERQNADLLSNGELGFLNYRLYYDGGEVPVYEDELELPLEEINLLEIIKADLTAEGEPLTPDIQMFLTEISNATTNKKKKRPERRKRQSKEATFHSPEPQEEEIYELEHEEAEVEEVEEAEEFESMVVESKPKKKNKKKSVVETYEPKKTIVTTKRAIVLGVFFVAIIGGFLLFKGLSLNQADEKPTYQELIKQEQYQQAAKAYPSKKEAIEQAIYDKAVSKKSDENKEALYQFQEKYPTTFGQFDLAILGNDYSGALKVYEKQEKDFESNNDRLTLVGYCYLKNDDLNKAQDMVEITKSTELERYIYEYEQKQAEISDLESRLEELKKNPIENREEIEKTMNELFDVKEELLNI